MPSLSPLSPLAKTQYSFDRRSILRADVSKYRPEDYKSEKNENSKQNSQSSTIEAKLLT